LLTTEILRTVNYNFVSIGGEITQPRFLLFLLHPTPTKFSAGDSVCCRAFRTK